MTKYIKKEEINDSIIEEVATSLREGKLAIFPTDTVYGIGTNAYDGAAVEKIYEIKGRPMYKPLCVLISEISMLDEMVAEISPIEQKLMDSFWPGPLTIKFKKKEGVFPDVVSAGDEYVRVRLIGSGILHDLIQTSGIPVVAPSANLSGSPTGTKMNNIINELDDKVDYILDYGDIESDVASTIIQVENGEIDILREGKITKEDLIKVVNKKTVDDN